jgi:hypothetical protein
LLIAVALLLIAEAECVFGKKVLGPAQNTRMILNKDNPIALVFSQKEFQFQEKIAFREMFCAFGSLS